MMDYTNQFLRFLLRRLTRRTTLYTEMVTANTIVHCKDEELSRFLGNNGDAEQPVVLQLGGADPDMLWRASEIAEPWGFTALNLNVGCPSDRVAGAGQPPHLLDPGPALPRTFSTGPSRLGPSRPWTFSTALLNAPPRPSSSTVILDSRLSTLLLARTCPALTRPTPTCFDLTRRTNALTYSSYRAP